MLPVYLDKCLPFSAFLPETSLNEPVLGVDDLAEPLEVVETLADVTVDIEGDFAHQEMTELVGQFVAALPEYYQTMARRYYWDEDSQSDIAADLGVTQQAVSYALTKVAKMGREFFGVTIH